MSTRGHWLLLYGLLGVFLLLLTACGGGQGTTSTQVVKPTPMPTFPDTGEWVDAVPSRLVQGQLALIIDISFVDERHTNVTQVTSIVGECVSKRIEPYIYTTTASAMMSGNSISLLANLAYAKNGLKVLPHVDFVGTLRVNRSLILTSSLLGSTPLGFLPSAVDAATRLQSQYSQIPCS